MYLNKVLLLLLLLLLLLIYFYLTYCMLHYLVYNIVNQSFFTSYLVCPSSFSMRLAKATLLLTNSMLSDCKLLRRLRHNMLFIFSLNRWLISAYTNGLTAELKMVIV